MATFGLWKALLGLGSYVTDMSGAYPEAAALVGTVGVDLHGTKHCDFRISRTVSSNQIHVLLQGTAATLVLGSGAFVHSYHSLSPERVYTLAMQKLKASPALAEVTYRLASPQLDLNMSDTSHHGLN